MKATDDLDGDVTQQLIETGSLAPEKFQEFYNVPELAQWLRVSENTVRDWLRRKCAPPFFRLNTTSTGPVRFSRREVILWLKEIRENNGGQTAQGVEAD